MIYLKRKILFFIAYFCMMTGVYALNHNAGGELYVTHISGNSYKIQVIYYYDATNYQEPPANSPIPISPSPPSLASVSIYRKINHQRVRNLSLPRVSSSFISLPNNICIDKDIKYRRLERIVYEVISTFDNATFSDGQGYYAIFQDYTRNNSVIENILGSRVGISLYAEFPRVFDGASTFINSNPIFNTLTNIYICNGQTSNIDFSATDGDGDILVYSLADPYEALAITRNPRPTSLPPPLPNTYPYPLPLVSWESGFSANNAIPSNVGIPLSIDSNTGQLTVNPAKKGVYAFVVKCEEFRAGVKIGEVRRDIQLFVDACQSVINTPTVRLLLNATPTYYQEGEVLTLNANSYPENEIRLDVEATIVLDVYRPKPVKFSITANNFINTGANRLVINPSQVEANASGLAKVKLRIPECLEDNKIYDFTINASNQQCPNEGIGKLNVKILFKSRNTSEPPRLSIVSSNPANITSNSFVLARPNDSISIELRAKSPDTNLKDSLEINIITSNFLYKDYNMVFSGGEKAVINTRATFSWQPTCDLFQINGKKDTLQVDFVAKRIPPNSCFIAYDTIRVNFVFGDTYAHFDEFLPPNAFSPNGDGINDTFTLSNLNPAPPTQPQGQPNPNLPLDNCLYKFEKFTIFNRWGKRIFESDDRNFAWSGENQPTGVYYYQIQYNHTVFKGIINLIK
ncbi:MAG: gliding motility-associated C-terminal domain-containing protein [Thermonemataceae bacterium]|nr:gliding motility-associated C-terminal domain-containing protein [Thermonemataceae bacterium]